ncbi:hypothetical protein [Kitasatospora sp. NPDC001175]|uniref:hypothetical protein n=1 Tax=Kitasatospora sp. NPDC001175 TaxID=3157103 RepID=UPI003D014AAB
MGAVRLAALGVLRPDEIALLQRIAAGQAPPRAPLKARETASIVLANIPPAE